MPACPGLSGEGGDGVRGCPGLGARRGSPEESLAEAGGGSWLPAGPKADTGVTSLGANGQPRGTLPGRGQRRGPKGHQSEGLTPPPRMNPDTPPPTHPPGHGAATE